MSAFWHLADIDLVRLDVRYRRQSAHAAYLRRLVENEPIADIGKALNALIATGPSAHKSRNSSGSLATLAAMPSSRVSRFAADRRRGSSSK
jgi:hypothetical protein